MDMEILTSLFGWMLVINVVIYGVAAAFVIFARDFTVRLEARVTGVPKEAWPGLFMDYLSRYKIGICLFNLAPWLALMIVG